MSKRLKYSSLISITVNRNVPDSNTMSTTRKVYRVVGKDMYSKSKVKSKFLYKNSCQLSMSFSIIYYMHLVYGYVLLLYVLCLCFI